MNMPWIRRKIAVRGSERNARQVLAIEAQETDPTDETRPTGPRTKP
jgi:hypothetical protein